MPKKKKNLTVVEVAMEYSLPAEALSRIAEYRGPWAARLAAMAGSVGGIGPLLRERVVAQADEGVRVIGVSLLYDRVWSQRWELWGQLYLYPEPVGDSLRWAMEPLPEPIEVEMYDGQRVLARAFRLAYGQAEVYFLDCPEVSSIVYPGWQDCAAAEADGCKWADELRLRQSWLLGHGALNLLKRLQVRPDIIVLSEVPTIFGNHRLVRSTARDPWFEKTRYVFNDHTPLEYAHPIWPVATIERLRIVPQLYRSKQFIGEDGRPVVDITELLVDASDAVYGVSRRHGEVMRAMKRLAPYAAKIETITNGVSVPDWQGPALAHWRDLSDAEILERKQAERLRLVDWLWLRLKLSSQWRQGARRRPLLVWTRRVTYYKRLDLLQTLVERPDLQARFLDLDVTLVVGGRIHQVDETSRGVMFNLLDSVNLRPEVEDRIVLLDNYNVWEAPRLFQGADGSIMVSNRGREASATGFMKSQVNGGLIVATSDGAIPESVFFEGEEPGRANGFEVPYAGEHPTAVGLLEALEAFARTVRDPVRYGAMARNALAQSDFLDVRRAAREAIALYERILG